MKLKQLIFLLILIPISNAAQDSITSNMSSNEVNNIKTAVQYYWDWNTDEDPIKAVLLLSEITADNKKNWLAPFWASYISTQIVNSSDVEKEKYLEKAQSFFDQAFNRFSYTTMNKDKSIVSNFNALQSLIFRLKGFHFESLNEKIKAKSHFQKSKDKLNMGIKSDPNNPILMVMAATEMASADDRDFADIIAAIALLEKAKVQFQNIQNKSTIDITYWNEHWIDSWLTNLKPPNSN